LIAAPFPRALTQAELAHRRRIVAHLTAEAASAGRFAASVALSRASASRTGGDAAC